jgi:hypothetical protein
MADLASDIGEYMGITTRRVNQLPPARPRRAADRWSARLWALLDAEPRSLDGWPRTWSHERPDLHHVRFGSGPPMSLPPASPAAPWPPTTIGERALMILERATAPLSHGDIQRLMDRQSDRPTRSNSARRSGADAAAAAAPRARWASSPRSGR